MVQLSVVLCGSRYVRSSARRKFIDSLRLFVKGGAGGMGYPKFGGVGGKGGDVYVEAKNDVSLRFILEKHPLKRFPGGTGGNSQPHRIVGQIGKDLVVACPTGVTIYTDQGHVLGNLDVEGDRVLVARGGRGGCVDNQFNGQTGQAHSITLDLKLIADVGLVGFPNAGKSTLLNAISKARPKIASYPFTTLSPEIGVIMYDDFRQISVADLPGLIEGAHVNIGLGYTFLKHVERTKSLLFVVDINGFQLSPKTKPRSVLETVVLLNKELELYREELVEKPAILVVNKMDSKDAEKSFSKLLDELKNIKGVVESWPKEYLPNKFIRFDDVIPIAAKSGRSVDTIQKRLRQMIDFYDEMKSDAESHQEIPNLGVLTRKNVDWKVV